MNSKRPLFWVVKDQTARVGEAEANILLGDTDVDDYRIGVTLTHSDDEVTVEAIIVYPCRVCEWKQSCEDCHS
jgi:hypothetical protein